MLKDTFILVPPLDEQSEIVNYLDVICKKIDDTIKKDEEKIANLHELKIRLVSDVVTGKIDVRGIGIPEYESVDDESAEIEEKEVEETDE